MIRFLGVLIGLGVFHAAALAQTEITVSLARSSPMEQRTQAQLEAMMRQYDLQKWTFTRQLVIDERAIPHSHPVLTLHTRHVKDDDLLLSTYVHEQLHWFLTQRRDATQAAIEDLQGLYPKTPVGFPEGSADEYGNYVHLLVIYLEYRALQELLGELRARQVMEFWASDHYTWLYRTVLDQTRQVGAIVAKRRLIPTTPEGAVAPQPPQGSASDPS